MVFIILEKRLDEKYTCSNIIQTLKDINFYEIVENGYVPTYTCTDLIDDLHDAFEFRTDYEIVTTKQIKSIHILFSTFHIDSNSFLLTCEFATLFVRVKKCLNKTSSITIETSLAIFLINKKKFE